jgi:hypothetical protein
MPREAAVPGKRMPGAAPPARPIRSAGSISEPAFKTTVGASTNKRSVPREPAFKTRGSPGNAV